jgi:hypothetical protein
MYRAREALPQNVRKRSRARQGKLTSRAVTPLEAL